jgi:hypothetical protein
MPKFKPHYEKVETAAWEMHNKIEIDPNADDSRALRKYALDMAIRVGNFEPQRAEDIIEDAIKIEAYLRGELESPDANL